MRKIISLAMLPFLLAACADNGTVDNAGYGSYAYDGISEESLSDASYVTDTYLMAAAPKYYIGTAYKVDNVQYLPMEDMTYNQTGNAGIVPTELNGTTPSNGETFNVNQMVATSKTLPLPTIARVTNLDNGSTVVVRVNNRGPYVNNRIMDLSPAAAQKLGITGTGRVQIQVLAEQSTAVKNATLGVSTPTSVTNTAPVVTEPVATTSNATGPYAVQVAAFYSEDSATALANRLSSYGQTTVINEAGMYKVRVINLDAPSARDVIDRLRSSENLAPGLLENGKWINADSI